MSVLEEYNHNQYELNTSLRPIQTMMCTASTHYLLRQPFKW